MSTLHASKSIRAATLLLFASALTALASGEVSQRLKNQSFESATPAEFWQVEPSEGKQEFSLRVDQAHAKDGAQALLVEAAHPTNVVLRQEVFLPVGTMWRLTGWVRSAGLLPAGGSGAGPRIGIEAPADLQGNLIGPAIARALALT